MRVCVFFCLVIGVLSFSCRYPDEFRNVGAGEDGAVLSGSSFGKGGKVFAFHINDQPTSFWRSNDVFRIPVGRVSVAAAFSGRSETVGYERVEFVVEEGGDYMMSRVLDRGVKSPVSAVAHPSTAEGWVILDRRDRVIFWEKADDGEKRILVEASREDCVFGQATAEGAVAAYLREEG